MSRLKRTGRLLRNLGGYSLAFVVVFGMTLYFSFPYEVVGARAVQALEAQTGTRLSFSDLKPYWVTGIQAKDVTISLPQGRLAAPPEPIPLGSVKLRLHPLSTLFGTPSAHFKVEAIPADVEGDLSLVEEKNFETQFQITRLDLGKLGTLWDKLGLGFSGTLVGEASLSGPLATPILVSGEANLQARDAAFGGGMVKGFSVPSMKLGAFELALKAAKGRLAFTSPLSIDSNDLGAEVQGTVDLRPVLATSVAKLELKFKFKEAFTKANSTLASIATGMLASGKGGDGFFHYTLGGRLGRPSFLPSRGH